MQAQVTPRLVVAGMAMLQLQVVIVTMVFE